VDHVNPTFSAHALQIWSQKPRGLGVQYEQFLSSHLSGHEQLMRTLDLTPFAIKTVFINVMIDLKGHDYPHTSTRSRGLDCECRIVDVYIDSLQVVPRRRGAYREGTL
jgi:hypothetical protein